jgi:MFS family permease
VITRGGKIAWFMCILGGLFFGYGYFQRVAPSVMIEDLMREFAVTAVVLGNLSAFYFYSYAAIQVPAGVLVDRWGPRRLLVAATTVCGLGSLLFAFAETLGPAYAGRFLIGLGAGFAWVCTLKLITIWLPPHRFAVASGLAQFLGLVGGVAAQAPLAMVVAETGWRSAIAGTAVFGGILAVTIWFVVRDAPSSQENQDAQAGLLQGLRHVVTSQQSWIAALFGAGSVIPMAAFAALWGVPYMMAEYGLDRPAAGYATSHLMFGWGIGAIVVGWFSDRIRRRRLPMILGSVASLILFTTAIYLPGLSIGTVQVLFFLYGILAGSFSLCFAISREHNPTRYAGVAVGFVNMSLMSAGALSQPLIGWLLDLHWDGRMEAGVRLYAPEAYRSAFLFIIATLVAAIAAGFLVRETYARQQG